MKRSRVIIWKEVKINAWWVSYQVSYRGKKLHDGSVYLGDGFNQSKTQRTFKYAFDEAEKWSRENGFDGSVFVQ